MEGSVRQFVLAPTVVGLALVLGAASAFAQNRQDRAANDPDPATVRALVQQALQQVQPLPSSTTPFVTAGPRVNLTIDDAVKMAMEHNIDIGVARITPHLTDFTIAGLEASYRLNLTSAANNTKTTQLPRVTTQGIGVPTNSVNSSWSAGIAQNLFRTGGNYSVAWTNSRLNTQSSVNLRNPQFQSGLTASLTQPLLRGFKIDATRASLQTNRISQQNDQISLQTTTTSTQANVRNAYWDLVYAIQAVEAAQTSLDLASRLVHDNQARVEIGTLAPIDVVSAQSEEANRRLALVQAEATVRTSELALKRLVASGTDDPIWTSSINPTDRPPSTPEPINLEAAVTRGLRERTDLQQSMNNLKISDINLRNQVDQTRPQLNLTATYGLAGLGGPFTPTARDPVTGQLVQQQTIQSGWLDALRNISGFDAPTWTVGFSFAYPLGLSAAEATVARSKLQLEQTQANVKSLQLQIATDITNAALNVQSSLESVQATAAARELAQKKLDAAQSKFEVGMATNFEVVQAQRDFSDAQNAELRAILNYRKALVNFEASQTVGTRTVSGVNSATGVTSGTGTSGGGGGTPSTIGGSSGSGGSGGSGGTGGPGGGL
jgi:outer membrane protein TolC